jgi:hypothetical protein
VFVPITWLMRHELTSDQAIAIALLRQRHPRADVVVHRSPIGIVVEARESERLVEVLRADYFGSCETDQQVARAA